MTRLLASTALLAILAMPAVSQTTDDPAAPATTDAPATSDTPALDGTTAPLDGMAPAPADGSTSTGDAPSGEVSATGFGYASAMGDMSANTFIGKRLYVSEADVDAAVEMTEAGEGWDDIGEISDLVIGQDGNVKAVLIDIGGFLGMGERTVSVSKDQIDVIRDGDSEDDYFLVFKADRAALEGAPEYVWPADQ
ncbi:PRC-barrel domain-containing protein [Gemmobacter sp. 24YEA27]|uniref:PRC-barrel domain-containing protein n=1 Tax=Gemmobacter sp. 24YEA27 TaxID=3040672 RepID=UPI0024B39DD7|nr:PRC-barrel domain-containing protein [Gemmobacter sp. 24YEA27]